MALVLCVTGFAVVADALVTSDAERLEAFLEAASQPEVAARIDAVLDNTEPGGLEVRVQSSSEVQLFGTGQREEFVDWLRSEVDVFDSREQGLLQTSTQLTDTDTARITTRLGDSGREQTAIYTLTKREGRWQVRSVRVL